ncbi:MAG: recombinase family protein [Candidatus Thiodiazotropha taylori]|nr:recombinase family protein [Candidatus Thiodiazotropha taylori]
MKVARIYQRVSTKEQDLTRQASIEDDAKAAGFYIAGVYKEQASGARADRPELLRMIKDLQSGEVVIVEKIDRISRLPLRDAEKLIETIKSTGAKLAIPGVVDLSELVENSTDVAKVVLEAVQDVLLRLSLQIARDDYEDRRERQRQGIELAKSSGKFKGRAPNLVLHERVIVLRSSGETISRTAKLANCSESQVKRIWKKHNLS